MVANDLDEAREYYRQMVEKTTLINSENVIAVQNLSAAPLAALLLRKLDAAYQQRIPIYLYVEPHVSFRGVSKSDLCELVGVLLDNALEAARQSPVPYVSLELRALSDETELVVRNTFQGPLNPAAFADGSTKPEHEGLGVRNVRQTLAHYNEAFLNYRVAGRYLEAQVLLG